MGSQGIKIGLELIKFIKLIALFYDFIFVMINHVKLTALVKSILKYIGLIQ